jgi:hypothetical protein
LAAIAVASSGLSLIFCEYLLCLIRNRARQLLLSDAEGDNDLHYRTGNRSRAWPRLFINGRRCSGASTASILSIRTLIGTKTRGSRIYEPLESALTWKYLALAFRRLMRFLASAATSYAATMVNAVAGFSFLAIVKGAIFLEWWDIPPCQLCLGRPNERHRKGDLSLSPGTRDRHRMLIRDPSEAIRPPWSDFPCHFTWKGKSLNFRPFKKTSL